MTELEILQAIVSAGALGIITYLFIAGRLVSQKTVDKLMEAQANHISDLKAVMEKKLEKMIATQEKTITILEQIRENGAMTGKRKK